MKVALDSVPASIVGWLFAACVGGAVIALPDTGPRLFSISEEHGPSAIDAVGASVVLAGYAWFLWVLWKHRGAGRRMSPVATGFLGVALGLGLGLVTASVASDYGAWWAVGVALAFVAQLALAAMIHRAERPQTPAAQRA